MRLLALLTLLAACDQGARAQPAPAKEEALEATPLEAKPVVITAPPPFSIRDTADYVTKAQGFVDQLTGIFVQGGTQCEVVAAGLIRFGEQNRTVIDVMTRYGKEHRDAQAALTKAMEGRIGDFTNRMMPTLTACMSNEAMRKALEQLGQLGQQQQAYRPR